MDKQHLITLINATIFFFLSSFLLLFLSSLVKRSIREHYRRLVNLNWTRGEPKGEPGRATTTRVAINKQQLDSVRVFFSYEKKFIFVTRFAASTLLIFGRSPRIILYRFHFPLFGFFVLSLNKIRLCSVDGLPHSSIECVRRVRIMLYYARLFMHD